MKSFYEMSQNGVSDEEICEKILQVHNHAMDEMEADITKVQEDILDFAFVKDSIVVQLVNAGKNEEILTGVPHIRYLDLAIVYRVILGETETMSVLITNDIMRSWKINIEELHQFAMENTIRLFPAHVENLNMMLLKMIGIGSGMTKEEEAITMEELRRTSEDPDAINLYVVTNNTNINGACVILYPGVLRGLADQLDSDLILLPSSVHECLAMPYNAAMKGNGTPEEARAELHEMVSTINCSEVKDVDILSDTIYVYNRDTDTIKFL